MGDSKHMDGLAVALLLVMGLVFLGGGGAFYLWQRRQIAQKQQEAAAAAAAERSRAEMEQRAAARLVQTDRDVVEGEDVDSDNKGRDSHEEIEASIRSVLLAQQRAWNAGDVDQFMEHYWKSDDVTFSSGGKLTRSWQAALENYQERYPSRTEMGTLSFQNLEVTPLGDEAALVLGDWRLDREAGKLDGNFTLVFRYIDGNWVIIHDHASRREE